MIRSVKQTKRVGPLNDNSTSNQGWTRSKDQVSKPSNKPRKSVEWDDIIESANTHARTRGLEQTRSLARSGNRDSGIIRQVYENRRDAAVVASPFVCSQS